MIRVELVGVERGESKKHGFWSQQMWDRVLRLLRTMYTCMSTLFATILKYFHTS